MTTETADLTTAALRVGAAFELALTPHPALAERLRAITNADDDQFPAATAALMLISAQSFISGSIPGSIPDLITATHPALPAILRTRWMQMDIHAQGGLRPLGKGGPPDNPVPPPGPAGRPGTHRRGSDRRRTRSLPAHRPRCGPGPPGWRRTPGTSRQIARPGAYSTPARPPQTSWPT